MSIRRILKYPKDEARLRKPSATVKRIDADLRQLIEDMKDTLAHEAGAGLAAPQIGEHQRVVLVRFGQDQGEMQPALALINPVITERGALVRSFDGCLSLPKIYTWDAQRPAWLEFTALGEDGQDIAMRVEGADAALVDHEVDHLDGVFFLDRLNKDAKLYLARTDEKGEEKLVLLPGVPSG
jgi:peptide deformylase